MFQEIKNALSKLRKQVKPSFTKYQPQGLKFLKQKHQNIWKKKSKKPKEYLEFS